MEARILGRRKNAYPLRPGPGHALVLALAVLGVHVWMLGDMHGVGVEATRPGHTVLRLRAVAPPAVAEPAVPAARAADASVLNHRPSHRPRPRKSDPASPPHVPRPTHPALTSRPLRALAASADDSEKPFQPSTIAQPLPLPTASGDLEIPIYPTALPPSLQWRYAVTRGLMKGEADLVWRRDRDRYEARLQVDGAAGPMQWHSHGEIDTAGVAPVRFVDQRGRRSTQAANFQRGPRRITYSGSTAEYPLIPGGQDRLSWMLQLAGVVQAQPDRWNPGDRIVLHVSGARGDADAWSFEVAGREVVELQGGTLEALKLVREPARPYDIRAEVWLDPHRHHMPVRVRMTNGQASFEMILRAELSLF